MSGPRQKIETIVNGRALTIEDAPADTMALGWLRAQGLISVKEGCGEGDCGACTVALGTPGPDGFSWRAVNSCLLFLPLLDGRAVMTAEGLTGTDGKPHPVQQAMADKFATQCGFCSPGFAMSLFALSRRGERDKESVLDALAGNLCRCTGYRPLVETAQSLPKDKADADERTAAASLLERSADPLLYNTKGVTFFAPRTIEEALAFKATYPSAWVLAGGTDLGLAITKRDQHPQAILWLGRVGELIGIEPGKDGLTIGASVPYTDVLDAVKTRHPALYDYMRRIGATQVRNLGTIGGNLGNASPIGDSMPALIALGAEVELAGPKGRRRVAVEDFVTGYRKTVLLDGEIIAAIHLPDLPKGTMFRAYKIAKRVDQDISAVSASFRLAIKDGKVASVRAGFGGVSAKPVRALALERALTGQTWGAAAVEAAKTALAGDIAPRDDFRGSAHYRAQVAANLIERLWRETAGDPSTPASLEAL